MSGHLRSILFITPAGIGDTVLSTGLLGDLAARHPKSAITVVTTPAAMPLFESAPNVIRVLTERGGAALWRQLGGLRRWGLVVDLARLGVARLLLARRRRVLGAASTGEHRLTSLARVLDLDPPPAPRLWLSGPVLSRGAELVGPATPVLALGPAASWGGRQWPAERFVAAARRLIGYGGALAGGRVMLLSAPDERAAVEPLVAALPKGWVVDLAGRLDVATAAACLARADLFIGNDSGLMHLAAASGVPTLGLFGPTDETVNGPCGEHCRAVRTRESVAEIVGAPGFDARSARSRMQGLQIETVVAAAARLVDRMAGAAA
ncbi:glycosyltransferase family 9 protein [Oceanibacterium hippocampi]|uniref:ADP-heptose--LPS heptosyltransferase 2 n=1 Tax=Oceanibacterium hippocampi TaxID=745714 RepID=A0A1Y5TR26_9PROT|nr:glycosyltransferase family 9 protein [Oceanibacterium hippocampi]SLN70068.1 ADP-heptose--LPS heptosyltransferase 2 [Oceanibacterium hippocampi]